LKSLPADDTHVNDRSPFRSLLGHVASLLLIANGSLILLNNPESTFAIFLCGSFLELALDQHAPFEASRLESPSQSI